MNWITDHGWVVWLIVAFALVVVELTSLDLVLLMLAGGALAGAAAAGLGGNIVIQILVFALVSLGLLGLVRPRLLERLHPTELLKTGIERLIGLRSRAVDVIATDVPSRIKIDGEDWLAQPHDPDMTIPAGTAVTVVEIRGATAYVSPLSEE